jgi:hypothetical protein
MTGTPVQVVVACANPRFTWSQARTSHIAMAYVACRGFSGAANAAAGPHAFRPPAPIAARARSHIACDS